MMKFDIFDIISSYEFCHNMIYVCNGVCRMQHVYHIFVSCWTLILTHLIIIFTLGRLVTSVCCLSERSCGDGKTTYRERSWHQHQDQCMWNYINFSALSHYEICYCTFHFIVFHVILFDDYSWIIPLMLSISYYSHCYIITVNIVQWLMH